MTQMLDRLVRLYDIPQLSQYDDVLAANAITIRRPRSYEKPQVLTWVREHFSNGWTGECDVTFGRQPITTFIATNGGELVGFCSYEATYRNFIGPLRVAEGFRGKKVGSALMLHCLHAMAEMGYAYAVIGGPKEAAPIYAKEFGAVDIAGSDVGIYVDRLNGRDS